MANFELGPRDLSSQERYALTRVLRDYRIPEGENFNPNMGTFTVADKLVDVLDRLSIFHKDLLGINPDKYLLRNSRGRGHEADILLQDRLRRTVKTRRIDVFGCRVVDNLASGLVDVNPVGLVRLAAASFNTDIVTPSDLYEDAFLKAQQGINPGIDLNTMFIEVHPDYVDIQRLILLRLDFNMALSGFIPGIRPDWVLIDGAGNLVPIRRFTLRGLLNIALDNDVY